MNIIRTLFLNLRHRFIKEITEDHFNLIKQTKLFDSLNELQVVNLLQSIHLVKFRRGQIIIKSSKNIKGIYIIAEGLVNVRNKQNSIGGMTLLNQLRRGALISANTRVGHVMKWNDAYLEAATDVTLIFIKGHDNLAVSSLDTYHYGNHGEMQSIIERTVKPVFLDYKNGEHIFNFGDPSDRAYIILEGKVSLIIPNKNSITQSALTLNKGHLFGELGILRNSPRAATAIAVGDLHLIAIEEKEFKKIITESDDLKLIVCSLQEIYRIPLKDKVELCLSDTPDGGKVITSIYNLEDGRLVVATRTLNYSMFTMKTMHMESKMEYQYQRGRQSIKLEVAFGFIIGIQAQGVWEILPDLCAKLLNLEKCDNTVLENFCNNGTLKKRNC